MRFSLHDVSHISVWFVVLVVTYWWFGYVLSQLRLIIGPVFNM